MESTANKPKSHPASQLLARVAIAVGVGAGLLGSISALAYFWPSLWRADLTLLERAFVALIVLTAPFAASAPGLMCLVAGYELAKQVTTDAVKGTVGTLTIITTIGTIGVGLYAAPTWVLSTGPLGIIGLLLLVAVLTTPGIFVYAIASRQVLVHDQIEHDSYRDILSDDLLSTWTFFLFMPFFIRGSVVLERIEASFLEYLATAIVTCAVVYPFASRLRRGMTWVVDRLSQNHSPIRNADSET